MPFAFKETYYDLKINYTGTIGMHGLGLLSAKYWEAGMHEGEPIDSNNWLQSIIGFLWQEIWEGNVFGNFGKNRYFQKYRNDFKNLQF